LCSTIPIGPGWRTWITVSTSCSTCLRESIKKVHENMIYFWLFQEIMDT
jgi:hypothetical protein